jgi:sugar/nucleoside kinase (ribokinase family)
MKPAGVDLDRVPDFKEIPTMSLLVAGTLCIDTIETPAGRVDYVLGGSGAYAAAAASLLTQVHLLSVIGADFPEEHYRFLADRGIDLTGVERISRARTQRWHGRYHAGLRTREHVAVDMDIFDSWQPIVPEELRDSSFVFIAHMPPWLQLAVLDQLRGPEFILVDTIDHWITTERQSVLKVMQRATAVVVNEQEARLLTGEPDVQRAAHAIQRMGPRYAIVKQGDDGALLDRGGEFFALPADTSVNVVDTTGAGDSFAGALIGQLSLLGDPTLLKLYQALRAGVVAAGFTVEGFGLSGLSKADRTAFEARTARYRERVQRP